MAIMASKGAVDAVDVPEGERDMDVRSVVEAPRRSPAPRDEEDVP